MTARATNLMRVAGGRIIDMDRPIPFTFDGQPYFGRAGDSLAAALLANGVRIIGRSVKSHRPRGILSAGYEEPNALVQLGKGAHTEPNALATRIEIYPGLQATSVNRWPSLAFDAFAGFGFFSRFMPAGFYYKTFLGSRTLWERVYEPVLRRMAGFGRAPKTADPDNYDQRHLHCDVLVIGGGLAGIAAARAACDSGVKVVLIEDQPMLAAQPCDPGANAWIKEAIKLVCDQATVLTRTTAFGAYDGGRFSCWGSTHLSRSVRGTGR